MECGDGLACPTWPGGACRGPEPISPGLGFSELTVTLGAGSVVDTLLGSKEPSIQWKTRVHVLGEERDSKRVRALEDEIRRSPRVRALLSRRDQLGRPGTARAVYYKWHGVHWVLASLADIGYLEDDESLYPIRDRILEFWLRPSYYREFVAHTEAEAYRNEGVPVMEGRYRRCASQQGNPLYFLTILGLADDRTDLLGAPSALAVARRRVELRPPPFRRHVFVHGDKVADARSRGVRADPQVRRRRRGGRAGERGVSPEEAVQAGHRWTDHPPGFHGPPLPAVLALRLPRRTAGHAPDWTDSGSSLRGRARSPRRPAPARWRLARREAPLQGPSSDDGGERRLRRLGRDEPDADERVGHCRCPGGLAVRRAAHDLSRYVRLSGRTARPIQ